MDDLQWPRQLNKVITKRWSQLKNTLVMKDFVDYLIQKRVVTLDYWIGLKSKPISESERTEDFLALVMKFDQQKYNYFMEALLSINRHDLVKNLVKAQHFKLMQPKEIENEKRQSMTKKMSVSIIERSQTLKDEENQKDGKGQTDADQLPNEATSSVSTSGGQAHVPSPQKPKPQKLQPVRPTATSNNLHKGIGNVDKNESGDRARTPVPNAKPKKTVEFKEKEKTQDLKREDETERPGTSKSREEILQDKEDELKSLESDLSKKEMELKEQEKVLKEKEDELLTSLHTAQPQVPDNGPLSLPAQLQQLRLDYNQETYSTTTSSEILADVREQLKEMKRVKEEIESEHTTSCNTPKEEFARLEDFHNVQQNLDELKDEITTDRQGRENLQLKVEDLKHEVATLQTTIQAMEGEKEKKCAAVDREINKLKTELKKAQANYNEGINKIKMEMKTKNEEMKGLKEHFEKSNDHTKELEKRIEVLENDKKKYEIELQRYEKEVSDLRRTLDDKENELNDLRNVLEETENEKDDLIDELADLKNEVSKLKADKKKLESEKKTLLGRCVKPMWNQNPTGSLTTRRTTFK